jgi:uncharacterized membrane protein HdeD (DUF308 family)
MKKDTKQMLYATGWFAFFLTTILWAFLVGIVMIIEYIPQILEWFNAHREQLNIYTAMAASFFIIWAGLFAYFLLDKRRYGEDEE